MSDNQAKQVDMSGNGLAAVGVDVKEAEKMLLALQEDPDYKFLPFNLTHLHELTGGCKTE